jgi:competence protein ComEC
MAVVEADSTWTAPVKGGQRFSLAWVSHIAEIESRRLMVWSPLLLVIGIWGYFSLQQEPVGLLAWPLAVVCVSALLWARVPVYIKVLAIVLLGFVAAQLRTQWVGTPVLRAYAPAQILVGIVADVDVRSRQRFTLVLDVETAAGLPENERPRRILVQVTGKLLQPKIGEQVRLTADIAPLPRPAQPGAFDYGRQLYFQSIGATARNKAGVEILRPAVAWRYKIKRWFHDLRGAIGVRVRGAIPGPLGSFADALITGERASISRGMNDSLQSSGLFHILSISGLHMALVAGGAFWTLRALLALSPTLALGWPIKKWAAGFAIFVGLLYMLLADSGAATERSFIMIAVVFFAVLVDRPALSLHNLALAAVLILLVSPEQAMAASFQMSFMAVMGLAAFFQVWQKYVVGHEDKPRGHVAWRWFRRMWLLALASLATSLVAGTLSGIPAAHHFGRLAPYGVVANALALPLVSIVVMPAAMASVLLMPLGLDVVPLKVMGWGLQGVMLISDEVASWPGAGVRLPLISSEVGSILAFGAALLLLGATALRWLGLPLIVAGAVILGGSSTKPMLLVDERGGNVALVTPMGIVPALAKPAAASVSRWMAQAGDNAGFKNAAKRGGWTCSTTACVALIEDRRIVYLLRQPIVSLACPVADILVSQEPLRRRCKGKLATVDRFDVWRNGAVAIYADGRVDTVRGQQGQRPWVYEPRARDKR